VKRRDLERHLRAKLDPMTTREKAHKLLDELPEFEIEPVVEFMVSRGAAEQTARREAHEHLERIATGEDDGYDFTVSERLHASR
jgi:hypothetical protein